GASPDDIASISAWLQSQGFVIEEIGRGRNWIAFSGTAGAVQRALHTRIRHYRFDGELHYANESDPSIPAALEPLVTGVLGLDDFHLEASKLRRNEADFTSGGSHYLVPDDLATIYNIKPLYSAGFDGSGHKIVVVGETRLGQMTTD